MSAPISPRRTIEPEKTASPDLRVAGKDTPVSADWSTDISSPSSKRASAGTMSPRRRRMASPGTSSRAAGLTHLPSRFTLALIASVAFRAAMALPALVRLGDAGAGAAQRQWRRGDGKRTGPCGRLFSPGAPAVGLCIAKQSSRLPALLRFASGATRGGGRSGPVRFRPVRPEGATGPVAAHEEPSPTRIDREDEFGLFYASFPTARVLDVRQLCGRCPTRMKSIRAPCPTNAV